MCQRPLTPAEQASLERQGAFYGSRSSILAQHVFEGQPPYFATVIVGGSAYMTKSELLTLLDERQLIELKTVQKVFGAKNFVVSKSRKYSKCVLMTPRELGVCARSSLAVIFAAAAEKELGLLTKDAAAYAALQFERDWTTHAMVIVASESVTHDRQEYLFALMNGIVLQVVGGDPNEQYDPDQPFLFRRVK